MIVPTSLSHGKDYVAELQVTSFRSLYCHDLASVERAGISRCSEKADYPQQVDSNGSLTSGALKK